MNNILYFSDLCPDTAPFVAELKRLGIPYEEANISQRLAHLKALLRLRDSESAFAAIKAEGRIGIPVLHHASGALIFDLADLKRFV